MGIYVFGDSKWLHDGGHSAIALGLALFLWLVLHWPALLAFLVGCLAPVIIVEPVDRFAGGFLVTIEQRIRILQRQLKRRDEKGIPVWVPSPDNLKDIANYQIPWVLFLLFKFSLFPWAQIGAVVLALVLYYVHRKFYTKEWSW